MSDGLLVSSKPEPEGSYVITVSVGDDRTWPLDEVGAISYAIEVMTAACAAEYEAAVFNQLTRRDVPHKDVGQVVAELRAVRRLDDDATAPLTWRPGVNPQFEPFVALALDGHPVGQLTPAKAKAHACSLIEVLVVARLDADYRAELVGAIGLSDAIACGTVADIAVCRPEGEST